MTMTPKTDRVVVLRELLDEYDARRWAFYVHAVTGESGIAREAIRRQAFPAHTEEAWDACIDKAMAEVVLPEAANEAAPTIGESQ